MKRSCKNYVESMLPLTNFYAAIGRGIFHIPADTPRKYISIIYAIFLMASYNISVYYAMVSALAFHPDTLEENLFYLVAYLNACLNFFTWALSWYHCKTKARIVERITSIDETLRQLDGRFRYDRTYRFVVFFLVANILLALTLNLIDGLWFRKRLTLLQMLWIITLTHSPYHVSNFEIMNFMLTVREMSLRFTIINDIFERSTSVQMKTGDFENRGISRADRRLVNCWVGKSVSIVAESNLTSRFHQIHLVQTIKHAHLELCEITREQIKVNGLQIALHLAAYAVLLTGKFYDLYVNITAPLVEEREIKLVILSFWFVIHFLQLMIVSLVCGKTTIEAHRTSEIIHKSNNNSDDREFKEEITQFSLQIMQNPLSVSPAGFFTLDCNFVRTMIVAVTTYSVILIDMQFLRSL